MAWLSSLPGLGRSLSSCDIAGPQQGRGSRVHSHASAALTFAHISSAKTSHTSEHRIEGWDVFFSR